MSVARCLIISVIVHAALALRTADYDIYDDDADDDKEEDVEPKIIDDAKKPIPLEHLLTSVDEEIRATIVEHGENQSYVERLLVSVPLENEDAGLPLAPREMLHGNSTSLKAGYTTSENENAATAAHDDVEKSGWSLCAVQSSIFPCKLFELVVESYHVYISSPHPSCPPHCPLEVKVGENSTQVFSLLQKYSDKMPSFTDNMCIAMIAIAQIPIFMIAYWVMPSAETFPEDASDSGVSEIYSIWEEEDGALPMEPPFCALPMEPRFCKCSDMEEEEHDGDRTAH